MNPHELYEVADRELKLGLHDRPLLKQALEEARGVKPAAVQVYWRLRSEAIRRQASQHAPIDPPLYLREIRARLDREQQRRNLRAHLVGWMWVAACFAGLVGAFISFIAAKAAFAAGRSSFYGYSIGGIGFLAVGIAGYVVSRRDAGADPFAMRE